MPETITLESYNDYIRTVYISLKEEEDTDTDSSQDSKENRDTRFNGNFADPSSVSAPAFPQPAAPARPPIKSPPRRRRNRIQIYKPKIYPCEICEQTYTRLCDLLNHDNTEHIHLERSHICNQCGKLFVAANRLLFHERIYHKLKIYRCDLCDRAYSTKKSLYCHILQHQGTYKCPTCKKTFGSKGDMRIHVSRHSKVRRFKCDQCDKKFICRNSLGVHRRTHSLIKLFKCTHPGCAFSTTNRSSLYCHSSTLHNDAPATYMCEICGRAFNNRIRLTEHLTRGHVEKRYSCEQCGALFKFKYRLRVHMRVHTGEKPYVCEICGKGFARAFGFREHKKMHEKKGEL